MLKSDSHIWYLCCLVKKMLCETVRVSMAFLYTSRISSKRGSMKKLTAAILLALSLVFPGVANTYENMGAVNMPVLEPLVGYHGSAPVEQRGYEFRKWLAPSVKIAVSGGSGSGTIVYYDRTKNIAYVATCGHLWDWGSMTAEEGLRRNMTCKIITWYQNDKKLSEPKTYTAKVIFYTHVSGADTALVTFQPDWVPAYFPIASVDYKYKEGSMAHSVGCDGGDEVAHYEVQIVGLYGKSLTTVRNSPRPGRSGGGLMDDKLYIATCVATSNVDGSGEGYFTPLSTIHQVWSKNGYDFLLKIKPGIDMARSIKIIDRNSRQKSYEKDYILVPN